jgi:hypothetical protein
MKREKQAIEDEWPLKRVHYLIKEDWQIESKAKPDLVGRWELTGGDNHGMLQQMFVILKGIGFTEKFIWAHV